MAPAAPATANPSAQPAAEAPPSPASAPQLSPSAHRPLLPPSATPRRLAPPCWTHEETLGLIDAYGDKWRALRRGHLRASHWQEVADALHRRCHRPAAVGEPKTAVQCRHKVEKLRQRYRAEKQRLTLRGKPRYSSWVYFPVMDAMELGASAGDGGGTSPLAAAPSVSSDDGEGDHNTGRGPKSPTPVSQVFMPNTNGVGGFEFRVPKALRSKASTPSGAAAKPKLSNGFLSGVPRPMAGEKSGERAEETKGDLVWGMVAAVEMLGDEFVKVEEMKMDMARDMERLRREMELKRTEMIRDSQRRIAEYIIGLREKKRVRVAPKS